MKFPRGDVDNVSTLLLEAALSKPPDHDYHDADPSFKCFQVPLGAEVGADISQQSPNRLISSTKRYIVIFRIAR